MDTIKALELILNECLVQGEVLQPLCIDRSAAQLMRGFHLIHSLSTGQLLDILEGAGKQLDRLLARIV